MATGADIYGKYQTVTNYPLLAQSITFAWVKLTDGARVASVPGDRVVQGCRDARIPVGGYHYAQEGSPTAQAGLLLAECRRLGALDIAPALDLEAPFQPDGEARDFGIRFCRAIAAAGHRPAVYMSASFAGALRPDLWNIPGLVIWLAAYGLNNGQRSPAAVLRHYAGRYDVHQYTSAGSLPGVRGLVDLNESFTDIRNHTKEGSDMRNLILARKVGADGKPDPSGEIWVGDGLTRRHIADPEELTGLQFWIKQRGGNEVVQDFADLRVLGDVVGAAPKVELDYARFVNDVADRITAQLGTITWSPGTGEA